MDDRDDAVTDDIDPDGWFGPHGTNRRTIKIRRKRRMNLIEQVLKLDAEATKGPWKRQAEDSGIITGGIAYDGEPGVVADTVPSDFSPCVSECFANAALIAFYRTAAPKLARALRVAMEFLDTQGDLGRSVLAEIEKELA